MENIGNKPEPGNEQRGPGMEYVVSPEGSLGLLALGARGIIAWRKKREEVKNQQNMKKK